MGIRLDPRGEELELGRAALATGFLVLLLGAAATACSSAWADLISVDPAAAPWPCAPDWPSFRGMGPFLAVAAVVVVATLGTRPLRTEPALRAQVIGLSMVATAVGAVAVCAPRNPLAAFLLLAATTAVGACLACSVVYRGRRD